MIAFTLINCALRVVLTAMIVFAIVWFEDWLTRAEKTGMGIMGGAGLLTLPVIFFTSQGEATPYDGWAACLFTLGAIIFFCGWMRRKRKHDLINERALKDAREHFARKAQR